MDIICDENGLKILESLDITATIFINTSFLKGGFFWRDKLRFILDKGLSKKFVIGYIILLLKFK